MEFEAFVRQPQKREERKKLFTRQHREPSTPARKRRVSYRYTGGMGEVGGIEKFRVMTWSRMRETIVRPRHFFLSTSLGSCYLRGPVISRWID